jgi:radical SAM protein with 4Fe4S-binding SPASM domain
MTIDTLAEINDQCAGSSSTPDNAFPDNYLSNRMLQLCNGRNTEKEICEIICAERSLEGVLLEEDAGNILREWKSCGYIRVDFAQNLHRSSRADEVLTRRQGKPLGVTRLLWDITRKCNLRCLHCYARAGADWSNELTFDQIKLTTQKIASLMPYIIVLGGGEPFILPNFLDIVAYIKKYTGSRIKVLTNGTLLTDDLIERMKGLVDFVQFSLDGRKRNHDYLRNSLGSFEKAVSAIERARSYGIPTGVCMTLFNQNIADLDWVIDFAIQNKLYKLRISPIIAAGRANDRLNEFVLTPNVTRRLYATLADLRSLYKDVILLDFRDELYGKAFLSTCLPSKAKEHEGYLLCSAGRSMLYVNPEGNITPCNFVDYPEYHLGNVKTDSLAGIWNDSPHLKEWRSLETCHIETCCDCHSRDQCGGGLRCNAISQSGNIKGRDPFCHFYTQKPDIVSIDMSGNNSSVRE